MKKIYEAPKMDVVRIAQQLLDAASSFTKYSDKVTNENEVLSREAPGFDLWDDED